MMDLLTDLAVVIGIISGGITMIVALSWLWKRSHARNGAQPSGLTAIPQTPTLIVVSSVHWRIQPPAHSNKARATVLVVMGASMALGAMVGALTAVLIDTPYFPLLSGIYMGIGVFGYIGLRGGEHVGRKVGAGIGY